VADSSLPPVGHTTDRLVGTAPPMVALRTQIRHLARFDTVGNPHVPIVLLQGARPAPARAWWRASSTTVGRGPKGPSSR
jgi:hypothetical protein